MARTKIYFDDPTTDTLLAVVLTLASEVWMLRERFAVIETLASRHGVPLEQEVEDYEFTAEQEARLAQLRNDFIGNLFRVLNDSATKSGARKGKTAGGKVRRTPPGAGKSRAGKSRSGKSRAGKARTGSAARSARKTSRTARRPK